MNCIFLCVLPAGVRAQFADIISALPNINVELGMRATMNPVEQRSWQRLADFLIMVMAVRERVLANLT